MASACTTVLPKANMQHKGPSSSIQETAYFGQSLEGLPDLVWYPCTKIKTRVKSILVLVAIIPPPPF